MRQPLLEDFMKRQKKNEDENKQGNEEVKTPRAKP